MQRFYGKRRSPGLLGSKQEPLLLQPGWKIIFDLRGHTAMFLTPTGARVRFRNEHGDIAESEPLSNGGTSFQTVCLQMARLIAMTHGLDLEPCPDRIAGTLLFTFVPLKRS